MSEPRSEERPAGARPGRAAAEGHRAPRPGPAPDADRERWRRTTRAKAVADQPERRRAFRTTSDLDVADVYTTADIADLDPARDLGLPGEFSFTRGVQPTMYCGLLWTMRQYVGFSTSSDTNRWFYNLLVHL